MYPSSVSVQVATWSQSSCFNSHSSVSETFIMVRINVNITRIHPSISVDLRYFSNADLALSLNATWAFGALCGTRVGLWANIRSVSHAKLSPCCVPLSYSCVIGSNNLHIFCINHVNVNNKTNNDTKHLPGAKRSSVCSTFDITAVWKIFGPSHQNPVTSVAAISL